MHIPFIYIYHVYKIQLYKDCCIHTTVAQYKYEQRVIICIIMYVFIIMSI